MCPPEIDSQMTINAVIGLISRLKHVIRERPRGADRQNHPLRVRRRPASPGMLSVDRLHLKAAGDFTNREEVLRMATLTAWAFPGVYDAENASQRLQQLQAQELIKIEDAAVVSWEEGKKKPKTKQLSNMTATGALGGTFWGMLFGLIFFVPLLGAAVGAAVGAAAGAMTDVGIDDSFINGVKDRVTPGTSALFVLSSEAVIDRIKDVFADSQAELIASNLSAEQEAKLREVFVEE
jgi:uncharacterized membrane protein